MKTPPTDLLEAAKHVIQHAYAPYSHFHVAASLRTEEGNIFSGCNVENASFPVGTCAEVGAIASLIAHGHKKITEALVLVNDSQLCPPCGACRQALFEHATPDAVVHLCTESGLHETTTVAKLLPHAFGPDNLHHKD